MTTQQAYENMRTYLGRPGAQRAYTPIVCRYETQILDQIHRCAVGCLLTPQTLAQTKIVGDDHNRVEMPLRDFCGTLKAVYASGYELPELEDVDHDFLASAQAIHDNLGSWEEHTVILQLDALARGFGLTVVTDEPVVEVAPQEELVVA